ICFILLAIMFFVAGLLSGMIISQSESATVSGISTKILKTTSEVKNEENPEKNDSIVKESEAVASEPEKPSGEPEEPAETEKDVAVEEKSDTEPDMVADASEESKPAEPKQPATLFSVEVASFVAQTRALKMIADLKKKKYEPCIVKMWDSKNPDKIWYVVQIGDYGNQEKANDAAKKFTETQGTVAIVRTMKATVLKERKECAE
ncbi:MAG: hypothetical protein GY750_06025, partial [Lentisphaerae bacterium]|nr:hypothetical protein [Lentisphaerota bacterium]